MSEERNIKEKNYSIPLCRWRLEKRGRQTTENQSFSGGRPSTEEAKEEKFFFRLQTFSEEIKGNLNRLRKEKETARKKNT